MSRNNVLKLLKDFKKNNSKKFEILNIGLFGSVARDEATENSDIDIVVTTKTPNPLNIVHMKDALEKKLMKHVDIVRLRDNMNSFLKERIKKDVIYV